MRLRSGAVNSFARELVSPCRTKQASEPFLIARSSVVSLLAFELDWPVHATCELRAFDHD